MNCPYGCKTGCPYVDTSGMDKSKSCYDCEYYSIEKKNAFGCSPSFALIIVCLILILL